MYQLGIAPKMLWAAVVSLELPNQLSDYFEDDGI